MKYKSVTGTIFETNLIGLLIDRCDNCNKLQNGKSLMDNDMLCNHCYYEEELFECEECGREITAFDYTDFNGLCGYCKDGVDPE